MARFQKHFRLVVAVLGGLTMAMSFPKIGVAGLGWVAPGIILASAIGATGRTAFRLGYLAGFVQALMSLSWLLYIPVFSWRPLSDGSCLALRGVIHRHMGLAVLANLPSSLVLHGTGLAFGGRMSPKGQLAQRLGWSLACAAIWAALEMIQARFLSGFPWNLLGSSQFRMLPVVQIASFTEFMDCRFSACGSAHLV
jgi:apolipoprotein N-acyltransferase